MQNAGLVKRESLSFIAAALESLLEDVETNDSPTVTRRWKFAIAGDGGASVCLCGLAAPYAWVGFPADLTSCSFASERQQDRLTARRLRDLGMAS